VLLGPLPSPHLLFPLFPFPCSSLPACCVVSRLVAQKLMLRRRVGRGGADDPIVPFDQPEAFVNIIGFGVLLGSLLAGCVTEDWYGILKTESIYSGDCIRSWLKVLRVILDPPNSSSIFCLWGPCSSCIAVIWWVLHYGSTHFVQNPYNRSYRCYSPCRLLIVPWRWERERSGNLLYVIQMIELWLPLFVHVYFYTFSFAFWWFELWASRKRITCPIQGFFFIYRCILVRSLVRQER